MAEFTDEDNRIIEEILKEQEEDQRIAEIQSRVNREIKERFGMDSAQFYALPDSETDRLLASDKSLEKRAQQVKDDLENKPITPAELSKGEFKTYQKLISNGADSAKAIDWIKSNDFGDFDDHSLQAIAGRLMSAADIKAKVETVEARKLLTDYLLEISSQGLSTTDLEDRIKGKFSMHEAREVIAGDKAIRVQQANEQRAIAEAKKVQDRAKAAKWAQEARQAGIRPDAALIAQRLGCDKKDISDLCK